ncbi:hypothetical protein HC62_01180 [Acetobacter tropicalis]|uniref:Uncharacterized protein n=1 Tax=Acetobacter tropicalis TaxID=104102 RepID=A0A252ABU4_9PROT|nr:hypothetical protein HC62_01180 [Acetobacter tropicalis]
MKRISVSKYNLVNSLWETFLAYIIFSYIFANSGFFNKFDGIFSKIFDSFLASFAVSTWIFPYFLFLSPFIVLIFFLSRKVCFIENRSLVLNFIYRLFVDFFVLYNLYVSFISFFWCINPSCNYDNENILITPTPSYCTHKFFLLKVFDSFIFFWGRNIIAVFVSIFMSSLLVSGWENFRAWREHRRSLMRS